MYYCIALGNIGNEYVGTRHNVAWESLGDLDWQIDTYGKCFVAKQDLITYLRPTTFMNASGDTVSYYKDKHQLLQSACLVVHDDVALPVGTFRVSFDRGDAGHNGVASVARAFGGSHAFARLRIGVGPVDETGQAFLKHHRADFVLARFTQDEQTLLARGRTRIQEVIRHIAEYGHVSAMQTYNAQSELVRE